MSRKRRLLAIQLGESTEYPDLVHDIPAYRDGIFYICSYLLSTGLYEIDLCQLLWGDSLARYDPTEYDAVLISGLGHQVVAGRELLTGLREAAGDKPIIMGGNHATFAPYDALRYADFAVIGSGEYPVETLLDMIFNGPYPTPDNLPRRVAMRSDDGALVIGGLSKKSPPMIAINPALFKNSPRLVWATVNFTRGCPYNCRFCYAIKIHDHKLIKKDVDLIGEELDGIHRATGCSYFYISDLSFGLDKEYTRRIIEKVSNRGYSFLAMARVELGDDLALVEELKRAGFSDFFLGIESLDDKVLASYNKKIDAKLQEQRVRAFTQRGLAVHGVFMFGVEGQTYEHVIKAASWAAENEISYGFFVCYSDYPYQKRLYGTDQMFPDWRIIQSSPAYQNYVYVSVFPTSMRPSKLQMAFVQGYKVFLEKRLSSKERSYRMTKVKIWRRNLAPVLGRMQEYAQYLETVEEPYYDSNDELLEGRLKDDYYSRVRSTPDHFENTPVIMRGAREEQLSR